MLAGLGIFQEQTGGFDDDIGTDFVPLEVGRIHFGGQADLVAIDHEIVAIDFDVMLENAMN